ncbi:hypothetical protein [Geothrix sp. 21YS21S-2]|uniref:hypothetical protein n=1 Tax=Geothrix sp. 21YS21S-2 TaxID=3068893 RepID=UPI0027B93BD8|nr:hypothetical protein [Geothrix sp. 21YS21S-2]
MKILALENELPGLSAKDFAPYLEAEAQRVWELQQADLIREIYFRPDLHSAVLVLECESLPEAESILASLPLVSNSLIRFELVPLAPYSGYSRLFSKQG